MCIMHPNVTFREQQLQKYDLEVLEVAAVTHQSIFLTTVQCVMIFSTECGCQIQIPVRASCLYCSRYIFSYQCYKNNYLTVYSIS